MTLLDLQTMATPATEDGGELANTGGSRASLLLCGNSSLSVVTCN
jgi:lanthionine-containing peptide SapB